MPTRRGESVAEVLLQEKTSLQRPRGRGNLSLVADGTPTAEATLVGNLVYSRYVIVGDQVLEAPQTRNVATPAERLLRPWTSYVEEAFAK